MVYVKTLHEAMPGKLVADDGEGVPDLVIGANCLDEFFSS